MGSDEVTEVGGFSRTAVDNGAVPQLRGERPFLPLSTRIELALSAERYNTARQKAAVLFGPLAHSLATTKYAILRAVRYGDFSEPWCYSIPAYTGGEDVAQRPVAVDGKLRTPQCFGGMGEPWAQTGDDDVGDDAASVTARTIDAFYAPALLRPATA